MFTRIQTRNFRCLKAVNQSLGSFRALVGPNASGKTTFLDVIGFLSDLVRNRGDIIETVHCRSSDFEKLIWMGQGDSFQLAVEAEIPSAVKLKMANDKQRFSHVRYEVEVGTESETGTIGIEHETLWLTEANGIQNSPQREFFPMLVEATSSLLLRPAKQRKTAITKKPGGNDNYYTEGRKSYMPSFKLGRSKSALANLPADTESFPVSSWFHNLLEEGVKTFNLNSQEIRQPSAPGLARRFQTDGSNLPWVINDLRKKGQSFRDWLAHVRTALEDIKDIDTIERPEDRHRYLTIQYENGAVVPSWLASDGTLRLLALTIPAYLADLEGAFLIEEPENGVHPKALETVLQSLQSIYGSQVLIATHSPVALNMLEPSEILCFAKDTSGATDIISGDNHPALRNWKEGEPDLGILFASGILS